MKVLQIINSLSCGGAEIFVTELSIALRKYCDIRVFTYAGVLDQKGRELENRLIAAGIAHHTLNRRYKLSKLFVPYQISRYITHYRPDIVHVHLSQSELFCMIASIFTPFHIVFLRTIHNIRTNFFLAKLFKNRLGLFFDFNIGCSEAVLCSDSYYLPQNKCEFIVNGISLERLDETDVFQMPRYLIKRRLGLPLNKLIMLNIGSMNLRGSNLLPKAQDTIIKAFSIGNLGEVADLVFLGDGKERNKLELLASCMQIQAYVHFVGLITNPLEFIAASDLIVMPSLFEGLPLAAIECACCGIPLVLSDISPFSIFQGPATKYCKAGSSEDLAIVLKEALNNIEMLRSAAEEQKKYYRNIFDINIVAKQYFKKYIAMKKK